VCWHGDVILLQEKLARREHCKIVKSNDNLTEISYKDFYTEGNLRSQNMDHISLPPVLPKRPSPNGTGSKGQLQKTNETELCNCAEYNLGQISKLTSFGQSSRNSDLPPKVTICTRKISYSYLLYSKRMYVQT
jgi:hypothetical protein